MFCPECGANNPDEAQFCQDCGAPLGEAASQAEPVQPLAPPPSQPPEPRLEGGVPPEGGPPTSGLAIAALVLGILGVIQVLPVVGSALALLFGYMARSDIRDRPAALSGEGLATAGIVLGWIGVGLWVLGALGLVLGLAGLLGCGLCALLDPSNWD
jgi:hypothetical protein